MPVRFYPSQTHASRFKSTRNARYAPFDDQPNGGRMIPFVWEIEHGQSLFVKYVGPGTFYIIEGQITATENGQTVSLEAGDVMDVEDGSAVTWSSPSKGKNKSFRFGVVHVPAASSVLEDFLKDELSRLG
ncbi:hypothetical protein BDN72DRAFT_845590 [Pluteus cervinus]|uniref:Uncharacterized protein n=1 Tax=Pluteus cervinus TaxID=181527 RepID=A0ACD3AIF7_9AGAR|nr:hypothetical protein BDN72DRAFT_845590 [Pluteus cervinus]